ncbi:CBU_0592 family membrane protein [Planobispora longispora]|uniref:CBU-0592-like domain-containing protein n=1 Tax=Planobispora longispora TaxID=28887 RepID=A0A8J3W8F1_9ACTN|nr:hypothetical protein [Planobispora longispora]BFE88486.1 hypothetical protein GCM10020093_110870 [Planobispora longispora]GIH79757.1 hypothetical protein Plo01_61860 [Planobispora longispora]
MTLLIDLIGWAGAATLLFAYVMASSSRMAGDGMPYQLLNLFGSIALMISTAYHTAWPSTILNAVWAVIGVTAVTRMVTARSRKKALNAS